MSIKASKKLKIKITPETSGGETLYYNLMLSHGENSNFSGLLIHNADQMRQVAAALIAKAGEIEHKQKFCEFCNRPLHDGNIVKIDINIVVFICSSCNKRGWKENDE